MTAAIEEVSSRSAKRALAINQERIHSSDRSCKPKKMSNSFNRPSAKNLSRRAALLDGLWQAQCADCDLARGPRIGIQEGNLRRNGISSVTNIRRERNVHKRPGFLLLIGTMTGLAALPALAVDETLPEMLAVQVRAQGYPCDQSLRATKDKKRSKPDHGVWVLKCSNATYRVRRAPDMSAKIKRLR